MPSAPSIIARGSAVVLGEKSVDLVQQLENQRPHARVLAAAQGRRNLLQKATASAKTPQQRALLGPARTEKRALTRKRTSTNQAALHQRKSQRDLF